MAKLFLKNAHEFENPSRRVFREGGELFGSTGGQAAKINTWVGGKESSPEAKALAESVNKQAEEIREGTRKELLELYVNLFTGAGPIGTRESYNIAAPVKVDATYAKDGILEVLEKQRESGLGLAFSKFPDLRLLAYATVFNNFKSKFGMDANYLPIGAELTLVNGEVTVSYTENGVKKTATSEIFPWSTYEKAHQKYLEILDKERAEEARRIEEAGGPQEDAELRAILGEPTVGLPTEEPALPAASVEALDERSEYEKRLDAKVDTFRNDHALTEDGTRIGLQFMEGTGTYNATLKKPDGTLVTINVRAQVTDKADQAGLEKTLEKTLDEELTRLEKKEVSETPTDLEKDWQRVWESVQKMVAGDTRLQGKITVSEGPRNKRGDDKTILVTNTETGESVRYMVGIKEKNNPKTYGPMEGGAEDSARIEDAKSVRITVLVTGNGMGNKEIRSRVSKYIGLEAYRVPNVEKGAYNVALILAGIEPIEEPESPYLIDVIFKDRSKPWERPEAAPKAELSPQQISDLLKVYPERIQASVDTAIKNNPDYISFIQEVPGTRNQLADADAGFASYYVQFETKTGERITIKAQPDQVNDQAVDAYIKEIGGTLPDGLTRDDIKQYLAYKALEAILAKELRKAERKIQRLIKKDQRKGEPEPVPVPPAEDAVAVAEVEDAEEARLSALERSEAAAMNALFITRGDGTPGLAKDWETVDDQYKKMLGELPPELISALHHFRGAQAAATDGRINDCVAALDRAAELAADGTQIKKDITYYRDYFKKNFGPISLNEAPGGSFTYTPISGKEVIPSYDDNTAVKYAEDEFKRTGHFEGLVPFGTYEVGTKVYTVTPGGTTILDKAKVAAGAANELDLAPEMTPAEMNKLTESYQLTSGADALWLVGQFPVGEGSYLNISKKDLPAPNPDGSVTWRVDLTALDGEKYILEVALPPVDMAEVQPYIDAQAALGIAVSKEELVQYLAYRAASKDLKAQADKFRNDAHLNERYTAYLAAQKKAAEAPAINFDDEEPMDLGIRSIPDRVPGLPEGDYKEFDAELFPIEDPYTGLVSLEWPDGTFFKGAMKNSVPNGMGVLGLGGAEETLGPVQFVDGKATVELPDGKKKEITWDTDLYRFEIRDR